MKILKKETTEGFVLRVKQIWPVFAAVCWVPTLLLAMLRYVFAIKLKWFDFDEFLWQSVCAILLPWPGILRFLLPRFRNLSYRNGSRGAAFPLTMLTFLTVFGMIMSSQTFMTTYFSEMRVVNTVDEISKYPAARYYKIRNYEVGPFAGAQAMDVNGSGRAKGSTTWNCYMVVPIVGDLSERSPQYFYGIKYSVIRRNNSIADIDRPNVANDLFAYAKDQILSYHFKDADHFEYTPSVRDERLFRTALERGYSVGNMRAKILRPVFDSYDKRSDAYLPLLFLAFIAGSIIILLSLIGAKEKTPDKALINSV